MKSTKVYNFSDIFEFADKHYNIGWNLCNDVFFGNSLDYGQHTTWYAGECNGYVGFSDDMMKPLASDYSKREVAAMSNYDKSFVILDAYFESVNETGEVLIDCT